MPSVAAALVSLVGALYCAAVLVGSGAEKVLRRRRFLHLLEQTSTLPLPARRAVAYLLPPFELTLGLTCLTLFRLRDTLAVCALVFTAFAIFHRVGHSVNRPCACLGGTDRSADRRFMIGVNVTSALFASAGAVSASQLVIPTLVSIAIAVAIAIATSLLVLALTSRARRNSPQADTGWT